MERYVDVAPGVRLWAELTPGPGEPLLLVMAADCSAAHWPDQLVAALAEHHTVIRYDHRDTGRSTWAFDDLPYAVADLAADAAAVLDAFEVPRAHTVGMGMGGTLVQLLLLDHPDRLVSATLFCTAALGADPDLPGPDPALVRLWTERDDPRDDRAELVWRVEQRRLLGAPGTAFDALEAWALEQRVIVHTGHHEPPGAHAHAYRAGLDRYAELAGVRVPTLVIEAPDDPVRPPPHAGHLADALGAAAHRARVEGMGHTLNRTVVAPLAAAILHHTAQVGAPAAASPTW